MHRFSTTSVLIWLCSTLASAQDAARQPEVDAFDARLFVPIHELRSSTGASEGVWTAGATYKARLDGGFTLFPVLGDSYPENLPLHWSTVSVRIGNSEFAGGTPDEVRVRDDRYEYRFAGGVTEAYDLGATELEQTFRIERRPASGGRLVVTGQLTTPLSFAPAPHAHRAVTLRGPAGEALVDYGAATAVDANGRAFPMTTRTSGDHIELALDAKSVAAARFPLTVDPVVLVTSPGTAVGVVDIASVNTPNPLGPANSVMFVYTRVNSASDHDALGYVAPPSLGGTRLVWTELSSATSVESVSVGAVNLAQRFVVGYSMSRSARTEFSVYIHDATTIAAPNSGARLSFRANPNEHYRNMAVGGANTDDALVVCDREDSGQHSVIGILVDPLAETLRRYNSVISGLDRTPVRPAITKQRTGRWLVAWASEGRGIQSDRSWISLRQATLAGPQGSVDRIASTTQYSYADVRVAGGFRDLYALTYLQEARGGGLVFDSVRAQTVEYGSSSPVLPQPSRTLDGGRSYALGGLAVDTTTHSHWVATWTRRLSLTQNLTFAARLGSTAAPVETWQLDPARGDVRNPAVAYTNRGQATGPLHGYALVWAQGVLSTTNAAIRGDTYAYPTATAAPTIYGQSCATTDQEQWDPAIAGDRWFRGSLLAQPNAPAACFVSQLTNQLPLDSIGMTGCNLLVQASLGVQLAGMPNLNSDPSVSFSLPDMPPFLGPVYTQWIYVAPGANALGVVANRGRAHQVQ